MVAVNTLRGILYGFRLIIYVLLVSIFGLIPVILGIKLFMEGNQRGIALVIIGFLITYAGSLGILYKVIADAVARGNKVVNTDEVEISNTEEISDLLEETKENESEEDN